jgi:DNA (cytosine-5)-methyltransferase 1
MKHLGDITKINGAEVEPVEVIIGGSPCQDLSIAGKRAGLDGARSGLFMEQIRIIKEMRDSDKRAGRTDNLCRPRFMVWENVPGAFSSNGGEDFRIVLEETAKIADPEISIPRPPHGKWTNAGCIMGRGYSIAWRVLDAQYFGVPQRRRRIALVADFGGQSAPEILFERKSLSGNTEQSETARQGTAGDAADRVGASSGVLCFNPWDCQSARCYDADGIWHSLNANENGGQSRDSVFCLQGNGIDRADRNTVNGE